MRDLDVRKVSPARPRRRDESGVAMILVITVVVTLVAIAVPFAISQRQGHERTESMSARAQAQFEADVLADLAKQFLVSTLPGEEQARRTPGSRSMFEDPDCDGLEEIVPDDRFRQRIEEAWVSALSPSEEALARSLEVLKVRGLGPMNNDRGSIWTVVVEDENAKVNPNGASPYLLANLLGSGLLAQEVDASATDIPVQYVVAARVPGFEGFPVDGGAIRIGREVIQYRRFDGNTFLGCTRGVLVPGPLGENGPAEKHEANETVVDYTAWKLATHAIAAEPGVRRPFRTVRGLREVGGLPAERLETLLPFLTVWSLRESAEWLAPQLVVSPLPTAEEGPDELVVRDRQNEGGTTNYFGPGTLLRIRDAVTTSYQMVERIGDSTGGSPDRSVRLAGRVAQQDPNLTYEGGRTTADALAPFPINVNTASKEVLFAVMANVRFQGADTPERIVTPDLAWTLAERIVTARKGDLKVDTTEGGQGNVRVSGPFRHAGDFGRWLESLVAESAITRSHQAALYANAINPHDAALLGGTAPWCYRTLDVYKLEARVSVQNRAGERVAEAIVQEVTEIGPDGPTSWTVDTQSQFEERFALGSGAKWTTTFPFAVAHKSSALAHVQPAPRWQKGAQQGVYPSDVRGGDLGGDQEAAGDVRLEPARIRMPGAVAVAAHMDGTWFTEGWRTDHSKEYRQKVKGSIQAPQDDPYVRPFTISFWWRPYSEADWTAFDCGMDKFTNRIAVFVTDGAQGKELVFRVCGGTLDHRGAECYVPLERIGFVPGTWYHIQASARGEDPTTMNLFVDGLAVGQRRYVTYLEAGVTADAEDLSVEDSEGFDAYGAVLVGTEVVEYGALADGSFRECVRGARGTAATEWAAGTPVRLLGYGHPLIVDIMQGGSELAEALGKWSAVRVDSHPDQESPPLDGGGTGYVEGHKGDQTKITIDVVALWNQSLTEAMAAFGSKGIALMGCHRARNAPGQGSGGSGAFWGWEMVFYEKQGASQFNITRYLDTAWQDSREQYFLTTRALVGTPPSVQPWPAFLIPVSVIGSSPGNPDAYLNPADSTHQTILSRYEGGGYVPAKVVLGTSNPENQQEMIVYDSIDTQNASPSLLFVRDHPSALQQTIREWFDITGDWAAPPEEEESFLPPSGGPSVGTLVDEPIPAPPPTSTPQEPGSMEGTEGAEPTDLGAGVGTTQTREEQLPPPGGEVPPPEEPKVDGSGGGDSEAPDVTDNPDDTEWPASDAGDSTDPDYPGGEDVVAPGQYGSYGEPAGPRTARNHLPFRGVYCGPPGERSETVDRDHPAPSGGDKNAKYLPCFVVGEGSSEGILNRVGRNDRITITDGASENTLRVSARIRWADPGSGLTALDDFLDTRVRAPETGANQYRFDYRGRPRILKFPCGELPDEHPEEIEFGKSTLTNHGVVTAYLDEVFVYRHPTETLARLYNTEPIGAESDEIALLPQLPSTSLEGVAGHDADCGLIDLDGELIAYHGTRVEGTNTLVLEGCVRGVLGTTPRAHPNGCYGRFVPDLPVSALDAQLTRDSASIPLIHTRNWPREGCARIVGSDNLEIVHYVGIGERDLLLPEALDEDEAQQGRGLFRGRFGTDAIDHDGGEIVFWQPFRYWDRYAPRRTKDDQTFSGVHDHAECSYVEMGKRVRGAWWKRFTWEEDLTGLPAGIAVDPRRRDRRDEGGAQGHLDLLLLARFSPHVPWDTDRIVDLRGSDSAGVLAGPPTDGGRPANAVYVFDDPDAANALGLESDSFEVRAYFVFRPGSYVAQDTVAARLSAADLVFENSWKRTPMLEAITTEYVSRTTTRVHDTER